MSRSVRRPPRRHWLALVVALVAMAGQLTVAFAPLAEGRDGRMASHVEASGTTGHVAAHNEAKCVSCQARSILGAPGRPAQPPIERAASAGSEIIRDALAQSAIAHLSASPRAPPVLT